MKLALPTLLNWKETLIQIEVKHYLIGNVVLGAKTDVLPNKELALLLIQY